MINSSPLLTGRKLCRRWHPGRRPSSAAARAACPAQQAAARFKPILDDMSCQCVHVGWHASCKLAKSIPPGAHGAQLKATLAILHFLPWHTGST